MSSTLDFATAVVPSSTSGHCHLYLDKQLTWEQYETLLTVMAEVGIIEPGYLAASSTFLRLPWIRKGSERDNRPFPSLEAVEAFLGDSNGSEATLPPDPWATPAPNQPPF